MIDVVALKKFPYSTNGVTAEMHSTDGDPFAVRDEHFEGLRREGMVRSAVAGDAKPKQPVPPDAGGDKTPETDNGDSGTPHGDVDIPEDWRSTPWFGMRALAAKLTDQPINGKEDAVAAIELEIERRKALEPA